MNYISVQEAMQAGVDFSMVSICQKLRKLAKLDRLIIDEAEHRNGRNKHLFSYINYCGYDVVTYIKEYLSNLQPYMLSRNKEQEKVNSFYCVLDNCYRVSLYIKVDNTFGEEAVISFHEDNKDGIARSNSLIVNKAVENIVPVFAEEVRGYVEGTADYTIKILIQRGMLLMPIVVPGKGCENGTYLVYSDTIESLVVDRCNQYIRDLYTSDLKLDMSKITIFSMLQQISYTSYGKDTFSSISLLIDSIVVQPDLLSKKAADFALVTYVLQLKLDSRAKAELKSLLEERYVVSSMKGISSIISRVSDLLRLDDVGSVPVRDVGEVVGSVLPENEASRLIDEAAEEVEKRLKGQE